MVLVATTNTRWCSFEPYSTIIMIPQQWSVEDGLQHGIYKACNCIFVSLHQPFAWSEAIDMKLDVSFCSVLHRWIYFSLLTSRKHFWIWIKLWMCLSSLSCSRDVDLIMENQVLIVLYHSCDPSACPFTVDSVHKFTKVSPMGVIRSRTSLWGMRIKTHWVLTRLSSFLQCINCPPPDPRCRISKQILWSSMTMPLDSQLLLY